MLIPWHLHFQFMVLASCCSIDFTWHMTHARFFVAISNNKNQVQRNAFIRNMIIIRLLRIDFFLFSTYFRCKFNYSSVCVTLSSISCCLLIIPAWAVRYHNHSYNAMQFTISIKSLLINSTFLSIFVVYVHQKAKKNHSV